MTNRVSVPKRELRRFHVPAPPSFRKSRGSKPFSRLGMDTNARSVKNAGDSGADGRKDPTIPTSSLVNTPKRQRQGKLRLWWLFWLVILSVLGGSVILGALFLTKLPPPIDCQKISPLSSDSERLYCAQLAAESGELEQLVAAIKLVENWPSDHPLHSEAQRMSQDWSEQIIALARQKVNQGDLSEAVKIALRLPTSSSLHQEVEATIADWKQQWNKGEELTSQFKDSLKVQKWQQAASLIRELSQSNLDYWRESRVNALTEHLTSEEQAWEQLEQARDLAKSNKPELLKKAIAISLKISPKSYVKAQAQEEQTRWSRSLLEIAAERFANQDFAGVISLAQEIPVSTSLYQEAQDWIRLGRASGAAQEQNIPALVDALAAAGEISNSSPIHQLAAQKSAEWLSQFQDHLELKYARALAGFGQEAGLRMAIDQAALVKLGSTQRIPAQTLIAQWQQQAQEIEDRKQLLLAQELAKTGKIGQLKTAVKIASQVQLGQPRRIEAQTWIAQWDRQIQVIEDQPTLDLARTLAQSRDLMAAISTAEQISSERALYPEAQEAIALWVKQVQTEQDRPILEAAAALAAQGRFDAAIATASHISEERALYEQAQALTRTWTEQRDALSEETPLAPPWSN
ncbi:hypothetical protein [Lyngbya aestuarii]|uniref:hypothetical protein n=1 Tax=Lyngbya aestuarii TaxID=118322 RepID=UPI00403DC9F8